MRIKKIILFLFLSFWIFSSGAQSVGGVTSGAATYCSTTNSGFVSVTGYIGIILNWESSTDGGSTWNTIVNAGANQTYFNLAQTTCYRAIVKNGSFPQDTSTTVCITIYPPSVGGTLIGGGTFCAGSGPGTLNLTGSSGSILFWENSTDGGNTWTTISNTTTTLSYSNIIKSTVYRVIVQNGSTCPKDTSTEVLFTIYPATATGSITGAATVCKGSNNGTLTLTGHSGSILRWESSIDSGSTWNSITNTTATQAYLNLAQTTWYRIVVKSGTCAALTGLPVIVTVSPPTVSGTLSGGGSYCGTPATGTLTLSGYTGSITGWLFSVNKGLTFTPIANTAPTLAYNNLPVTTLYKVVIKSGGCAADTSNIETVNVAPQTVAGTITSSAVVCPGENTDSILLTGNIGNVLSWYFSLDNGTTWTPSANTSTKQKFSGLMQTTWFMATVQSGSCTIDTTNILKIAVLPVNPVNAGADITITPGQSITLNGTGTGIPLWNPPEGLNNNAIFTPIATPIITTIYILSVIDTNGCTNSDTVIVTVNEPENITVANMLTPNEDGINDSWYIQDILSFPDNEVTVYSIYGNEVYHKKGYINDWKGTYNGSELPDGTYYYIVNLGASNKIFKGSLDILRN